MLAALVLTTAGAAPARAAETPAKPITIGWVGDVTSGSRYGVPPRAGDVVYDHVRRLLHAPDLMIGNLEGTFSRGGRSKCGTDGGDCFSFQAPPTHAGSLHRAGFDLMNVANNHAWDFFASGRRQTLQALRTRGISYTGLPGQIRIMREGDVKVAVLGFAPYAWASNLLDIPRARRLVARAARLADVVVVCIHAGAEGVGAAHVPHGHETAFGEDRGATRAFAHAVVNAGADLVVGSGPHVIRGIERYRRRLIAYSLGNFASWHNFGMGGLLSLSGILTVQLSPKGRTLGAHVTPIRLVPPGVPVPDRARRALSVINALGRADFGRHAALLNRKGVLKHVPGL